MHCGLDLQDINLSEGHDTPFRSGQHPCEILSKANKRVRISFWMCIVTTAIVIARLCHIGHGFLKFRLYY